MEHLKNLLLGEVKRTNTGPQMFWPHWVGNDDCQLIR